jgi:raffinose/stachyose/melibiose transport system substrate-binding protein
MRNLNCRYQHQLLIVFIILFTFSAYFFGRLEWDKRLMFKDNVDKLPVKIRYAFNWTYTEPAGKIVIDELKRFSARTGIEVVQEIASGDELRTKIKVDAAVRDLPDIFNYWGGDSSLFYLVHKGYLLEINEYLKLSKSIGNHDFDQDAFKYFKIDGKYYGIPIMDIHTFWGCNQELFAKYHLEYPKTYDDLKRVAKIFRANGIIPLAVGSKGGNPANFLFSELYCQLPGGIAEIKSLQSSYRVDTDNLHRLGRLIEDMRRRRFFPDDTFASGSWSSSLSLYNTGKAAMCYSYNYLYNRIPPQIVKNTVLIPVPKIPGGVLNTDQAAIASPGFGFVINRQSFENPEKTRAIVQLADLLTDDKLIEKLAAVGVIPVKKTVKIENLHLDPFLKELSNPQRNHQKLPAHFFYFPDHDTLTIFQDALDELWNGAIDTDRFIFKIQQSLDESKLRR